MLVLITTVLVRTLVTRSVTVVVKTIVPGTSGANVGVSQVSVWFVWVGPEMGGDSESTPSKRTPLGNSSVMVTSWARDGPLLV